MAAPQRFPWVAVSAVVALVLMIVVVALRVPESVDVPVAGPALPSLGLTRFGLDAPAELLAEQLAAYDPTPMYIPSAMNSNMPVIPPEALPGAGGPFAVLPPDLTKTGVLKYPSSAPIPATAVGGLRLTERADAALVVGRVDTTGRELSSRAGQVEAVAIGGSVATLILDLPASLKVPGGDWQPLDLLGAVTRAGLVGELVVTASSGSEEIDDFFRSHLQKKENIGARLQPGFYAFRVGP
jgi:hypothetical protein